ncbi:tetratricopeptide repeat protein [Prochlorococcus marinus]|uniref:tetratricopeptide repeat protein n=2 Tax=Prochlorococcus marinus TaxID=1219 RepID=UPI0021C33828|nr:tetratricopeptide repeat protein [Prochlorococcus marinus]
MNKEQRKEKIDKEKIFTVPFSLKEVKENITISANNPDKPSKEKIINQAFMFHAQGNISEAAKYYKNFINQGFKDHRVFSNYGVILKNLGKLQDAKIAYQKAIELNPHFAEAHSNLSLIFRDLGKLQDAEIAIRKAIELNPHFAEAHSNLSLIFRDLGKLQDAEIAIRKAIKLNPNCASSYKDLGICQYLIGDIDSAFNSILKANSIDPEELGNKILLRIFHKEKDTKNSDLQTNQKNLSLPETTLNSNPLILHMPIEVELINSLYKIKARDQEKYQAPTYGDAKGSDYKLFEINDSIIKITEEKLISIAKDSVKSDIFISESFFTIFRSGGGLKSHDHLNKLDKVKGLNLANKKYSLVYYVSVGDQDCDEPGILKLKNPNQEILPNNGLIVIFPARRKHSVFYKGNKDRIIIGVNFYRL